MGRGCGIVKGLSGGGRILFRRREWDTGWPGSLFRLAARFLVLAALLAISVSCSSGVKKPQTTQGPVPVTVATVVLENVPIRVSAIGNAEAFATVTVKPQVSGQLTSVLFTEGQDVRKGQRLFTIDPRPYEQALKQSEALFAKDNALAQQATADAAQYASLAKQQFVSQDLSDHYRATATAQAATAQADEALVENARLQLAYCAIASPIDGRAGSLLVDEGNVVQANTTPLVTINTISPIYVTFTLPERSLSDVRSAFAQGEMKVEALPSDGGKEPSEGTLVFIDNSVDSASGTFLLKGLFANRDERLWPGEYLTVVLTLGVQRDVPVIPAHAVQEGQNGEYVFVVGPDRKVESRPVVLSHTVGDEAVIAKGLQAGEIVVTDGQLLLAPSALVEVKGTTAQDLGSAK